MLSGTSGENNFSLVTYAGLLQSFLKHAPEGSCLSAPTFERNSLSQNPINNQ